MITKTERLCVCTHLWHGRTWKRVHGRTWKKVTRAYREKPWHGRTGKKASTAVPEKVDTAVYTEEMLTRPCTHSVHLLSSVRLHILACTLIRPRTGRVYRIRTTYVPTIQDCLCFSQINTWMWKKQIKTNLTWTIENPFEKTMSCPDGSIINFL